MGPMDPKQQHYPTYAHPNQRIEKNSGRWELSALLCLPRRSEREGGTRIIGIPPLPLLSRDHRGINYFTEKEEEIERGGEGRFNLEFRKKARRLESLDQA